MIARELSMGWTEWIGAPERVRELDVQIPANAVLERITVAVDAAVGELGLTVVLLGTLKTFPGCVHWHLKRGRVRGTLVITWWPKGRRLWIKVQAGRSAEWTDEVALQVKVGIELLLRQSVKRGKKRVTGK